MLIKSPNNWWIRVWPIFNVGFIIMIDLDFKLDCFGSNTEQMGSLTTCIKISTFDNNWRYLYRFSL